MLICIILNLYILYEWTQPSGNFLLIDYTSVFEKQHCLISSILILKLDRLSRAQLSKLTTANYNFVKKTQSSSRWMLMMKKQPHLVTSSYWKCKLFYQVYTSQGPKSTFSFFTGRLSPTFSIGQSNFLGNACNVKLEF